MKQNVTMVKDKTIESYRFSRPTVTIESSDGLGPKCYQGHRKQSIKLTQ